MDKVRQEIYEQVQPVVPFDDAEAVDRNAILQLVQSGEPVFRIEKPAKPPKHLVSYFALYDPRAQKVLLVNHNRARIWLTNGGHVEMNENPRDTAVRECQ
jgi:hypothetical protein